MGTTSELVEALGVEASRLREAQNAATADEDKITLGAVIGGIQAIRLAAYVHNGAAIPDVCRGLERWAMEMPREDRKKLEALLRQQCPETWSLIETYAPGGFGCLLPLLGVLALLAGLLL